MAAALKPLDTLLADRERRWRAGERLTSEQVLEKLPGVAERPEWAVSVIAQEFSLLEQTGESPLESEFLARFPEHAERLAQQFNLRHAMADLAVELAGPQSGPKAARPAQAIGPYRVRRQIGQDRNGTVYKAIDERRSRPVILKVLGMSRQDRRDAMQRVRREARAASKVRGDGIGAVVGIGKWRGKAYLVMEHAAGVTLEDWLHQRGRVRDIKKGVAIGQRLARALSAVHATGLLHGQLHPASIVVGPGARATMYDFGFTLRLPVPARPFGESSYMLVEPGVGAGEMYLPPERRSLGVGSIGPASDVYSLGVILYQLLTGTIPTGRPAAYYRPEIDHVLNEILKRATATAPEDRFTTADALGHALDGWRRRNAWR